MPHWMNPSLKNTMYIFYPGRGNSQTGVARFVGGQPFYTTTGEISYSERAIFAMPYDKIWLYPEMEEINRVPDWGGWSGWYQLKRHAIVVRTGRLDYYPPYPTNEKGSVRWYALYPDKVSMAQEPDLRSHKKRFDTLMDKRLGHILPDNVVLYGPSRGAATSFIALARHKDSYQNVKLCVLEAPPATYTAVAKYFLGWLGKWLYRWGILRVMFGLNHHPTVLMPKDYVSDFPDNVPLVVAASIRDNVVPFKSSLNLALAVAAKRIKKIAELGEEEARRQNIMPVYFIQLDNSRHSLALGDASDKLRYQQCLHAIYKKHHLPYLEIYADGYVDLSQLELTRGVLRPQVMLHDAFKKNHHDRLSIQNEALRQLKSMHALGRVHNKHVLEVCKYMAPYRKSPRRFCFFGESVLQHEVSQLQSLTKFSY